jgi:hypothetical protein
MRIRVFVVFALATLVSWTPAQAVCPGECSFPGKGSTATECMVEYDGVTVNYPVGKEKQLRCTDGDLACDLDGVANGLCRFQLRACLNNTDSRFPDCTPTDVATFTLKNKPITSIKYDTQIAALQAAVDALGLPTAASVCTPMQTITVPLKVKSGLFKAGKKKVKQLAFSTGGIKDADALKIFCLPSTVFPGPATPYARAKQITSPLETIGGPLGRSQVNDFLLVNDKIKVAILRPGRHAYNAIGAYGGNIIDGDWHHPDGVDRDSFEILVPGLNIENTAHYTSVTVLNDGTNNAPAVIRATGVDDLLDFINASSVLRGMNLPFPAGQDDTDLPVTIQTDYSLAAGDSFVKVETTVTNTSGSTVNTFLGEYLNGSGEIEMFQRAWGFGEPLVTDVCNASQTVACTAGSCDLCNFIAYSGENSAKGVSYGFIHAQNGSSAFATDGVAVPLFGRNVALTLIGGQGPNVTLQPTGNAGDAVTLTSYFAIGDGTVGSIESIRNQIQGITTGTIAGTVTDASGPVEDADVAVLAAGWAGGPTSNVATHFRTAADGTYSGTLPPGNYTVLANKDGRLAASPASAPVILTANATSTQNFTLPLPGRVRVTVTDENGDPISAKVQLVGFDPSPDPGNSDTVVILNVSTGVFGDYSSNKDGLPFGIAQVSFAGRDGDTGEQEVEPGNYQVAVTHGTRYSAFTQNVTVTAGALTTVTAQIAKVVPTPGFITGDWHVHSINSADAEVTNEERVLTELADGTDFFTPSDHEIRVGFAQTIADLGVSDLIGTATSAEITSFDYGHFNSWPVTIDASKLNAGSVDHGGAAPIAGQDFPSYGNYNLTPAEIYAAAHADPLANLIQINHMSSHFGTGQSGLGIDTGLTPPESSVDPAFRRLPGLPTDNLFDSGFDALEVWIGTDGRSGYQNALFGQNLGDWANLMNQGILRAGVASSDTHQRLNTQMNARTYLASAVTDPGLLAAQAETLAGNAVEGRAIGTNGPFVTINAEATCATSGLAEAGLGIGEPTLICDTEGITGGSVDVTLTINSPAWAKYDTVELYVNSATQLWDHDATASTPMRYRALPDVVLSAPADFTVTSVDDFPSIPGATHWTSTVTHTLTGLTGDVWILAVVKGTDGTSEPIFPFYPNSLTQTGNTTLANLTDGNLNEGGMLAVAYTNPLYVDVDSGGWTAPGVNVVP